MFLLHIFVKQNATEYKSKQLTRSKSSKNILKSDTAKTMETKKNVRYKKSFKNGVIQLKRNSFQPFKKEVMMFLALNSDVSYYQKERGERSLNLSEMSTIERVFKKHGVTQNIWSDPK